MRRRNGSSSTRPGSASTPRGVAVGGDSAGGNLAAVMALLARDGAIPPLCAQLLIYPATDLLATYPAYQRITEGFPLTANTSRWFLGHYIRSRSDALDWRASPLRAADSAARRQHWC